MAVLQAARASKLGLSDSSARSWGLNRAIFYAAAKRGFKGRSGSRKSKDERTQPIRETPEEFFIGDEKVYKSDTTSEDVLFTFGGKMQTDEEWEKRIGIRFGGAFEQAWSEALEIVDGFEEEVLLSQNDFFGLVYKPIRDVLSGKWDALASS
jgi:hypothetical protein